MTPIVGFDPPAGEQQEEQPKPKRKRRTKAEIERDNIAAAVIPGDDDPVTVVMKDTGTPAERPWLVAVEMYRDGKVELNKDHQFAVKKIDLEREAAKQGAQAPDPAGDGAPAAEPQPLQEPPAPAPSGPAAAAFAPQPDAASAVPAPQDKIFVRMAGANKTHVVSFDPSEWELARALVFTGAGEFTEDENERLHQTQLSAGDLPGPIAAKVPNPQTAMTITPPAPNDDAAKPGVWKVSMGYLEKIGLPDYSSLQVGPAAAQHMVIDDGRRQDYDLGDRRVSLPVSVIEGMQKCAQVCEAVMRAERSSMINFLESQGRS